MASEFDVLKSYASAAKATASIEKEIAIATGMPMTVVRETVQSKANSENGNLYAAATKWLYEIKARTENK